MKKNIILVILTAVISICNAQSYQVSELKGIRWKIDNVGSYCAFSDSLWTTYLTKGSESLPVLSVKYYLSNTKDSVFNDEQVGKETVGKYIVTNHQLKYEGMALDIFEIVSLTPTMLMLKAKETLFDFYNLPDEEVPTRPISGSYIR